MSVTFLNIWSYVREPSLLFLLPEKCLKTFLCSKIFPTSWYRWRRGETGERTDLDIIHVVAGIVVVGDVEVVHVIVVVTKISQAGIY